MFQISAFDPTGKIAEILGDRACAFVENWQMPTKLRSAIVAQSPGPTLCASVANHLNATKPAWNATGRDAPLTLTSCIFLRLAEGDDTLPASPFLLNDGRHGRVLYRQPALALEYEGFGIESTSLERVAGSEARALVKSAGLERLSEEDGPVILNPPSDYFQVGIRAWGLSSFDALVDRWIGAVRECIDRPLALSLHPGLSASARTAYAGAGVPIVEAPIEQLLARASLFVSYISTTTRLAAAYGTPIVISDCYRFVGSDWPRIPNAIRSDDEASFRSALVRASGMSRAAPPDHSPKRPLRSLSEALLAPRSAAA